MSMTDKVSTMVILKNSTSSESDCLQSLSKKPGSLQQDYIFPTHDIDKTISSPHSPNRLHFEIQPETSQMEAIFTTNSSIESITSEYKKDLCIELHTTEKKTSECLQSHPISIFEHKSHPKDFEINPPLNDVNEERERQKEKERERNRRKEREREREKEKEKQKEKEKELRERNRERDRGRDREREKKREREKDRERAREREQEREYRYQREKERERQRKKEKEDERDRERERDPDRGRDSSAYRSSRYSSLDRSFRSDRGRTRHRSTSRDRSYIETESPKSPSRISSSARSSSISDLPQHERDKRTVFVAQLHAEARQREIRDFFEKHGTGPVRDVKLIADKGSRRMKGLGYIEFMEEDSVEKAIELTGQVFMGIPIIVQRTEAEKNRAAEAATVHVTSEKRHLTQSNSLYIGNLPIHFTESDIQEIFSSYGRIENIQILKEYDGRSKGAAFVTFARHEDCKLSLKTMQGYYVEGIQVKCNLVAERHLPVSSELDDSETVGLKLNPQSRSELMHKLARSERQSLPAPPFHFSPSTSHLPASVNLDQLPSHAKTRCLMLTNMFNPLEETEINWDKDIEVDVKEECQQSYGPVSHIRVIRASPGHVYIKFGTLLAAERAFTALNGRWFSSRQITASYLSETAYNMKFPEAITV